MGEFCVNGLSHVSSGVFVDRLIITSHLPVTGTKVFVMPGGMMKCNGNLVELIEKVKPEIRTLIEKCNTVSLQCPSLSVVVFFREKRINIKVTSSINL